MSKLLIGISVFVMSLFLSFVTSTGNAAEKIFEMKIASPFTNATTNGYAPEWMANELKRRGLADGQLDVKCYSNAQLGGEVELFNKIKAGTIQMTVNSFQVISGFNDKAALGLLPFLFDTDEKAEKYIKSPMLEEVGKSMESQGVKNLGYLKFGRFGMFGKKPIKTTEDLKGIKIRIAESPVPLAIFKALGIQATPTPWVEVYESLKRGIVDGIDMSIEPVWGAKLHEVVKYGTLTAHVYGFNFVFVNKKWFESLPGDVQEFIADAVKDVCEMERMVVLLREEEALRDFKRKGITVINLTSQERLPFIKMVLPVHKQYLDRIGRDLVKRTYDLVNFPYAKEVFEK